MVNLLECLLVSIIILRVRRRINAKTAYALHCHCYTVLSTYLIQYFIQLDSSERSLVSVALVQRFMTIETTCQGCVSKSQRVRTDCKSSSSTAS